MFEVFAGMCFYTALAVRQCDDYIVETYDDQLTCEIVANDYGKKDRWINPACIPTPEVEAMPEGEEVSDPVVAVSSFFVDNLDAQELINMYVKNQK